MAFRRRGDVTHLAGTGRALDGDDLTGQDVDDRVGLAYISAFL
jgi:hypothetical protein